MTYRILLVASEKEDYGSLYKYLTVTDTEGNIIPYEAQSVEELDAMVESMLNGNYAKKDFIIVSVLDYAILADIAE